MGTICSFETLGNRLSSDVTAYPEERNPQEQWRQDVNTFAPKRLGMYDCAAPSNANKSIRKVSITAIQDAFLSTDFVQHIFFIYNKIFGIRLWFHQEAQTIWWFTCCFQTMDKVAIKQIVSECYNPP
jgi:hypothetical protein